MRVAAFIWFSYSLFTTIRNFKSKQRFYKKFFFMFSIYILSVPLLCLISYGLSFHVRYKFLVWFDVVVIYLAQTGLVIMYNPTFSFTHSFPFHHATLDGEGKKVCRQQWQWNDGQNLMYVYVLKPCLSSKHRMWAQLPERKILASQRMSELLAAMYQKSPVLVMERNDKDLEGDTLFYMMCPLSSIITHASSLSSSFKHTCLQT